MAAYEYADVLAPPGLHEAEAAAIEADIDAANYHLEIAVRAPNAGTATAALAACACWLRNAQTVYAFNGDSNNAEAVGAAAAQVDAWVAKGLPIAPAAHHLSGGVVTDLWGATALPGLWAVGEVACTGVHGANRLASNSLLEGMVFGARLAERIESDHDGPEASGALRVVLGFLLLDYTLYIWHWMNHGSPWLWRFHAVHHIDRDLDTTTGLRFHFGELARQIHGDIALLAIHGIQLNAVFCAVMGALSAAITGHASHGGRLKRDGEITNTKSGCLFKQMFRGLRNVLVAAP